MGISAQPQRSGSVNLFCSLVCWEQVFAVQCFIFMFFVIRSFFRSPYIDSYWICFLNLLIGTDCHVKFCFPSLVIFCNYDNEMFSRCLNSVCPFRVLTRKQLVKYQNQFSALCQLARLLIVSQFTSKRQVEKIFFTCAVCFFANRCVVIQQPAILLVSSVHSFVHLIQAVDWKTEKRRKPKLVRLLHAAGVSNAFAEFCSSWLKVRISRCQALMQI